MSGNIFVKCKGGSIKRVVVAERRNFKVVKKCARKMDNAGVPHHAISGGLSITPEYLTRILKKGIWL